MLQPTHTIQTKQAIYYIHYSDPVTKTPSQFKSLDEADMLCLRYNWTRKFAVAVCTATDKYNLNHPDHPRTSLETANKLSASLAEKGYDLPTSCESNINNTNINHGFSPVTVQCNNPLCLSVFHVLRSTITTIKIAPKFCIFCGMANPSIIPCTQEESAFLSISRHYNLSVEVIKALYDDWTHHNYSESTFSQFIAAPDVQKILPLLIKKLDHHQ